MKKIMLAFLSLLFTSCTEVRIIDPNPHVEVPEVRGDRGLSVGAQGGGGHIYRTAGDGSSRPPDLSAPQTFATLDANARVTYSPSEPLDLGVEIHPLGDSAGGALVFKYMLKGEGTRAAQKGDWPLAVYGKVGGAHSHASGNQDRLFGPGGYPWQSTMDSLYIHAGLSGGVRIDEHALIYWGAAYGHYFNRTEVTQDTSYTSTPVSPGGVYKTSDYGDAFSVGPGVMFNWKYVQFYVAGEFAHIQYHNTVAENDLTGTAGVIITPR